MKSVAISGSIRSNGGKKDAKALRNSGMVPCILYGGKEQVSFAVEDRAFKLIVYTPDVHVVEIDLNGTKHNAILKELQLHPVTDKILHVDFQEVITGKAVTVSLPVLFTGTAPGVRAGGKLIRKMRKLAVRGPVESIPEDVKIDVSTLEIGGVVRVADDTTDFQCGNIDFDILWNAFNGTAYSKFPHFADQLSSCANAGSCSGK